MYASRTLGVKIKKCPSSFNLSLLCGRIVPVDFDALDLNRRTRSMGIRLYEDQLEALRRLAILKHRRRRKIADLIREAIDQYIERETK